MNAKNPHISPKTLILAVETSGRTGSAAIALGDRLIAETSLSGPMKHSTELFPAISAMLEKLGAKPAQINQIYISSGPGSFTGLRIAVTFAKTMNLANNANIITLSTLDVIAENATDFIELQKYDVRKIAVVLDAKRNQFFIAVYQKEQGKWKKSVPDSLMTASEFLENYVSVNNPLWVLGEGLVYYKNKFKADGIFFIDENFWTPKASMVYKLGYQKALEGKFADPLTLQPKYMRITEAEEKYMKTKIKK